MKILTYLLIRRYNRFEVLACRRSVRNRSWPRVFVCQSIIPTLIADVSTPSYHLHLGLLRLLCPCGWPKKTLRAGSSVSMRTTWPTHRSLASLIRCTTVRSPQISYSSSLQLLLYCPSTHTGPSILLSIFLSNAAKKVSSDLDSVHVSEVCVSTGTTQVLYSSSYIRRDRLFEVN